MVSIPQFISQATVTSGYSPSRVGTYRGVAIAFPSAPSALPESVVVLQYRGLAYLALR